MNPIASPPIADPFAIGWRDVPRTLPDGSVVVEQIPLTLEDALHPQEGDVIVMNTAHNRDWRYLQDVFERQLAGDKHALVLGDCKVLWEDGLHHSPDLAAIFDVAEPDKKRGEFDVAAEGTRPKLIVEIVSPSTRDNDVKTKVEHYHRYKVPVYVIVNRAEDDAAPTLVGYQWSPKRYKPLEPEDNGRLWLEAVGVYLGTRDDRVIAYDVNTDEELGDYVAVSAALAAAQARADAAELRWVKESRRANAADDRATAADDRADSAEEGRQAAETARQAAETAKMVAEEARQAAEAREKAAEVARQAAEERTRQLEAELAGLRVPRPD